MRLAKSVKFREEKFGGVLFETRSEKVFTLNPTAAAVVRELQAGRPEHEAYSTGCEIRCAAESSAAGAAVSRAAATWAGDRVPSIRTTTPRRS